MKKIAHHRGGFTLVEVVVYIAIVAIIVTGMGVLSAAATRSHGRAQVVYAVESQGAAVLEHLAYVVENAQSVSSPSLGGSGSSLTVVIDDASRSPVTFSVYNGIFLETDGTGKESTMTNDDINISDLNVEYIGLSGTSESVLVQFVASSPSTQNGYDYTQTFYGTFTLHL